MEELILEENEIEEDLFEDMPDAVTIQATEKLEKDTEKLTAEQNKVITYLKSRCLEDYGLCNDIIQEHKTWEKCWNYIREEARKLAKGGCAMVEDDVVYEWSEDYFRLDDKAEEERKAKEAEERKKKEAERKAKLEEERRNKEASIQQKEQPDKLEGQMTIMSLFGGAANAQ